MFLTKGDNPGNVSESYFHKGKTRASI